MSKVFSSQCSQGLLLLLLPFPFPVHRLLRALVNPCKISILSWGTIHPGVHFSKCLSKYMCQRQREEESKKKSHFVSICLFADH